MSAADLYLNRFLTTDTMIESSTDEDDDAYTPSLDVYSPAIVIPYKPTLQSVEEKKSYSHEKEPDMKSDDTNNKVVLYGMHQLIAKHIVQKCEKNANVNTDVLFDSITYLKDKICLLSSNGLKNGYYEWIIKIRKCDIYIQEIGVMSTCK
eukprot:UN13709